MAGAVTMIDHEHKTVTVSPSEGPELELHYDIIVVTAGAVTRKLAIPGVADQAIGMKHVEEAVAIRDKLLTAFDKASVLEPGPLRSRLLTVTFVGGGFSGVEGFGELLSLATSLLKLYPGLQPSDLNFHLVEAQGRILPEVTDEPGQWVVRSLEKRGAHVHLNSLVVSAEGGHVVLSTGEEFDTELMVWTAGNAANPMVRSHTDLPIDSRGLLTVLPDLRVGTKDNPVDDAWGRRRRRRGPGSRVRTPGCADRAERAARSTAGEVAGQEHHRRTTWARAEALRAPQPRHRRDPRAVPRDLPVPPASVIKGFPAWLMHRGYHVLAVPTWERKIRVLAVWLTGFVFGRDIVSLASVQHPRDAFLADGVPAARPAAEPSRAVVGEQSRP